MACRIIGAKQWSNPMLIWALWLNTIKISLKRQMLKSAKIKLKCHVQNGGHFFPVLDISTRHRATYRTHQELWSRFTPCCICCGQVVANFASILKSWFTGIGWSHDFLGANNRNHEEHVNSLYAYNDNDGDADDDDNDNNDNNNDDNNDNDNNQLIYRLINWLITGSALEHPTWICVPKVCAPSEHPMCQPPIPKLVSMCKMQSHFIRFFLYVQLVS